ncbi:MAG: hypothetical protein R3311_13250, partial [Oceanisphaera sp.]|nr:hypothetical protein [Oceanisphaera sp.]
MSTLAFLAVMLAAALHATWNAIVKGGADKHLSMTALTIGQGLPAIPLLALWSPFPDASSWWLIAVSAVLHIGYQLFLLNAYRLGDFTQVYPIARGSAPLIVTLVSVTALGVALTGQQLLAIVLIASGIIALGLVRRADGLRNPRAAALALGTGCFIAGYSLVDGIGARAAGTGPGFYACAALLNAVVFAVFMVAFIYPVEGYWKWGGGFLDQLGFQDFAGSVVVHMAGAAAALAAVLIIGPRAGKYGKNGETHAIP